MAFWNRNKEPEQRSTTDTETTLTASDVLLKSLIGDTEAVTAKQAMQIPAFAGCVNFIKDTVSMLPVKLYKADYDEDGRRIVSEIEDDVRCKLLNADTGDTLSGIEMKAAVVKDLLLYGESYVYINKVRNKYKSLNYIQHGRYSIATNSDPIFKSYEIFVDSNVYYPHNFVKALRGTENGAYGVGVVAENNQILQVAYNTLIFEGALVSKGGNKKGFLKSQKRLTQEAINALKAAWKNLYANNEENVVVLNDGLEFQESSNTSVELQLNQNKETNKKEICSIFKISPSVLDNSANDEEYNLTIKMAVLPILNEITTALNRDLLLEKEKESFFFAFDTSEIMRGDIEKRYNAYSTAVNAGWITKNEIRAKENMVSIEGLDVVSMSLGDVIYDTESKVFFTPNTSSILGTGGDGVVDVEDITQQTNAEISEEGGIPDADES